MESKNSVKPTIINILNQMSELLNDIDDNTVNHFINMIVNSRSIFLVGAGRSGLVAKAFAIRLVHLGFPTFVIGETITIPVKKNDLIILISGSGETIPVTMTAEIGRRLGAKIISITANPDSHIARFADLPIILKPDKKNSKLAPLGTLFEASAWIFLDGIIAELMERKGENEESMKKRHATLQ